MLMVRRKFDERPSASRCVSIARVRSSQLDDIKDIYKFPVMMRLGDTPVLIPNTMVKT